MRTLIELSNEQIEGLERLKARLKTTRSQLIRTAIADFLSRQQQATPNCFGLWKRKPIDGVEYQRSLRREWDDK